MATAGRRWEAGRNLFLSFVTALVVYAAATFIVQLGVLAIAFAVVAGGFVLLLFSVLELRARVDALESGEWEESESRFEPPTGEEKEVLRKGLREQLKAIAGFRVDGELTEEGWTKLKEWRWRSLALLKQVVGPDSEQYETFAELDFGEGLDIFSSPLTRMKRDLDTAQAILKSVIEFA